MDRFSKIYVIRFFLENNIQDYYVNSFFNLILIWNKGVAFGFFQAENFFYNFISLLILFIIMFMLFLIVKTKSMTEMVFYSIIIGGAFGNFFDRIYYNAVPDFLDFHYKNFHWFTFNVSDICITLGILFLITCDLLNSKNLEKK